MSFIDILASVLGVAGATVGFSAPLTESGVKALYGNEVVVPEPSDRTKKLYTQLNNINRLWARSTWEYPTYPTAIVIKQVQGAAMSTINACATAMERHSNAWDAELKVASDRVSRKLVAINDLLKKFQSNSEEWTTGIDAKAICMDLLLMVCLASNTIDFADANDALASVPEWAESIIGIFVAIVKAVADVVTWIAKSGPRVLNTLGVVAPYAFWGVVGYYGYRLYKKT